MYCISKRATCTTYIQVIRPFSNSIPKAHTEDTVYVAVLINHVKPTGYVMHQQFNIQQLYALPTLYLCVLYLSENKQ